MAHLTGRFQECLPFRSEHLFKYRCPCRELCLCLQTLPPDLPLFLIRVLQSHSTVVPTKTNLLLVQA